MMKPKIRIRVLTIFPDMFKALTDFGVIGKAIKEGIVDFKAVNLRDYTTDKHRVTDKYAYGGGPGLVMIPEPFFRYIDEHKQNFGSKPFVILTSPQGVVFNNHLAKQLSEKKDIVFFCGRYEGIDERVNTLVDMQISIGDYVLTGGELAAMVIIESLLRFVPGVVGKEDSVKRDSFYDGLLDHSHYTRPREYRGLKVPEVLLSGDHKKIELFRKKDAMLKTILKRPDLFMKKELNDEDKKVLIHIIRELVDECSKKST